MYGGKDEPYVIVLYVTAVDTNKNLVTFNYLSRFTSAIMRCDHFIICKCTRKLEIK